MTSIVLYFTALFLLLISFIKDKNKTKEALKIAFSSFENIMPQFLSIIILIGIILSIINPEVISKIIGQSSGFIGILLSCIIGSITLMPTFVAFSLGNTLLLNGAGLAQVGALISTLTLVGALTYPLESQYIGKKAALLRNLFAFFFSILVAIFLGKVLPLL